jgi:hypothetical protein
MTTSTNKPKNRGQLMKSLNPTIGPRRGSRRHLLTIGAWLGAAMTAMAFAAAAMLFEDEVFVRVRGRRGGDDFVLNPRKRVALSAFHHPYALRPLDTSKYATPAARAQLEV